MGQFDRYRALLPNRPSLSGLTAVEVATDVGTSTGSRDGKSDSLRVLSRQYIDLAQQQLDGGPSPGNRHEHAGGRLPHGQNLHTTRGGPSWRRSESNEQRASSESGPTSGRARALVSQTCAPIYTGALIIQHPHRDARSNGSTEREPFLPSVPLLLWGDAPIIHRKGACDARTAAHVELGLLSCGNCARDRHVRPTPFLPYVPSSRRDQPQRLAAAKSIAVATSTHGADDTSE
jgi:hypothetical protein